MEIPFEPNDSLDEFARDKESMNNLKVDLAKMSRCYWKSRQIDLRDDIEEIGKVRILSREDVCKLHWLQREYKVASDHVMALEREVLG
jgi:hypothetical protein